MDCNGDIVISTAEICRVGKDILVGQAKVRHNKETVDKYKARLDSRRI